MSYLIYYLIIDFFDLLINKKRIKICYQFFNFLIVINLSQIFLKSFFIKVLKLINSAGFYKVYVILL